MYKIENVYSLKISNYDNLIVGLIIDIGQNWIAIKYIPVDYVVDGLMFINRKQIVESHRGRHEMFVEKVLSAKGIEANYPVKFDLNESFFQSLRENAADSLIQISCKDETKTFIGRMVSYDKNGINLSLIDEHALWVEESYYKYSEIKVIQIANDYLFSMQSIIDLIEPPINPLNLSLL